MPRRYLKLIIIFYLFICSWLVVAPTATADTCSHKWKTTRTIRRASCTEDGEEEQTCSLCGGKRTRRTSASGHRWSGWIDTISATCTLDGVRQRKCSVCSRTESQTIKATHYYDEWMIDIQPTCTEMGLQHHECTACGEVESETIEAQGHIQETQKASSCTEDGQNRCQRCDVKETIPASGHTWRVTQRASCQKTGWQRCTVCTYQEQIPLQPHQWQDVTSATCSRGGTKRCTVCKRYEETSPIEHSWVVDLIPGCVTEGHRYCAAAKCGAEETLPALGHQEVISTQSVEPTCEEQGRTEQIECDRCGEILHRSEALLPLEHQYETIQTVDATAQHDGYTLHRCSRCGDEYTDQYIVWVAAEHIPIIISNGQSTTETPLKLEGDQLFCEYMQPVADRLSFTISLESLEQLINLGVRVINFSDGKSTNPVILHLFSQQPYQTICEQFGRPDHLLVIIDNNTQTIDTVITFGSTKFSVLGLGFSYELTLEDTAQ